MLKPIYCRWCGELLEDGCTCERDVQREISESKAQFIEDYENDPMVQAGWAFQDRIDRLRMEM